jgi:hypothetical protein
MTTWDFIDLVTLIMRQFHPQKIANIDETYWKAVDLRMYRVLITRVERLSALSLEKPDGAWNSFRERTKYVSMSEQKIVPWNGRKG